MVFPYRHSVDSIVFMLANFTVLSLMYITFLSLETLESGQMESYFTNLDFPEIRGFPFLSYLLGAKPVVFSVAYNLTSWNVFPSFLNKKNSHQEWRFPCEKISASFHTEEFTRFGVRCVAPNTKGKAPRESIPRSAVSAMGNGINLNHPR